MIDLGIIQLPFEALNVLVIATAIMLAAVHIGFDVVAAIVGLVAVVFGIRVAFYEYDLVVSGHFLGIYEAITMILVGGFLVFRGTGSFLDKGDVNTWR